MEDRCRNRSAQRLVANDLDRAVCPDPSALSPTPLAVARLRRGPPQIPVLTATERVSRWRASLEAPARLFAQRYLIRTATTGLSPNGTTREECGASAAWRPR